MLTQHIRLHRRPAGIAMVSILAFWQIAQPLQAATLYWDAGGGATTAWTNVANWNTLADGTGVDPAAAPGAADTAVFNVSTLNAAQTAVISATLSVGGLVFNNTGTTGIRTDGTANRGITLGAGGITINQGAGTVTFGTTTDTQRITFTLGGSQTWLNNSATTLTLNNNNTVATAGFALTFDGTGNVTTGTGAISGTGSLIKNGTGTLTLAATNTFTGGITLNSGKLMLNANAALGGAASILTINGGTIDVSAARTTTNNNAQVWNGDFTFQGTNTWNTGTGAVNLGVNAGGTRTVTVSASTLTIGGVLANGTNATPTNNLRKAGAGTLALTAASTITGQLTLDGGTLSLSGNGTLAATSGVALGNRSTFTLDNTGTNLGDRTAGAITSTGGTLIFLGNAAATTETLGALTLNAGSLTITSTPGAGGSTLTIPSITRTVGTTLYVNGTGLGTASNGVVLTTANTLTNSVLNWAVVNNGTVTRFATHGGNGTSLAPLTTGYQAAETAWTGATVNALPTASVILTANRTAYTLTLDAGVDWNISTTDRSLTLSGAILQTGGTSQIGGGSTTIDNILAWGANEAMFHVLGTLQLNRGNTNTLTGTAGLSKSGAGTLIMNGVSTLTTATAGSAININEGVLELRGATALLPASSTAVINMNGAILRLSNDANTSFTNGQIAINADTTVQVDRVTAAATATTHTVGALTMGAGRTLSVGATDITTDTAYGLTTGALTLNPGGAIFNVANNGTATGTLTVGLIGGAFGITKTGAGDFVTNSATTGYTAPVTILAGRAGWGNTSGSVSDGQIFSGAGGIVKIGAGGTVNVTGANTFTGPVAVGGGILQFSTVNTNANASTTPSNLGQGVNGLTLFGGTLSFIGAASQATDRAVLLTASGTLSADGTGGATITYSGNFTATTATDITLTLTGTGDGFITSTSLVPTRGSGDLTKTGTGTWTISATGKISEDDILVNGGTLNFSGAAKTFDDDVIVTGATSVLNLNTTGVLSGNSATSAGLYARTGGIINLNANDAYSAATGLDFIILGDSGGGTGTLNLNSFNMSTPRFDAGLSLTGYEGVLTGTGTLTVNTSINLYQGNISANLAGAGAVLKNFGGTLTLSGNNSGLNGLVASEIRGGTLILDYTASNTSKLPTVAGLRMTGGALVLNGNATSDTAQSVAGLILSAGGASTLTLNGGGSQQVVLSLGAISHTLGGSTARFVLPAGAQSATNGFTTTQANVNGIIGGYATVFDGTMTGFATNSGGNIVALASTAQDDVALWTTNMNVTDSAGYHGTLDYENFINSIRFNAAAMSTITLSPGGVLDVVSSGILQTANATGGADSTIAGGLLRSTATNELIFTVDSASNSMVVTSTISGSTVVTKSGLGTLRLAGISGFTGGTVLNSGRLQVAGGNAIGDSSSLTLSVGQSSVFELVNNETIGSLLTGGANHTAGAGVVSEIRLDGNTLTLNQSTAGTYSGVFTSSGAGTLIKAGAETLTITSVNSGFTGTLQVNEGLMLLNGNFTTFTLASAVVLNGSGSLQVTQEQTSSTSVNHVNNAATILLNNTAAGSGLYLLDSEGTSNNAETVGALTLGAGHNIITATSSVADNVGTLTFASLAAVNNHATSLVRGIALGDSAATQRGQIVFNPTAPAAPYAAVGLGTNTGTQFQIFPYLVGDISATGLGNSLVRNTGTTNGLKPLTAAEYITNAAGYNALTGAATDNVRFDTNPGAALTGAATAINALVLDGAAGITVTGPASSLEITSGVVLSAQAAANTLDGYSAITTGAVRDYTIYVTDPGGSLTLGAALTTAAPLVKSGAGTLVLTASGNTFTDVYFNHGAVQADALNKLGTGTLNFLGGTLKFGGVFDPSTKTISLGLGGGTFDTNNQDITLANAIGNNGVGGLVKTGAGSLVLQASATNTGATTVREGRLVLRGGAANRISTAGLTLGGGSASGVLQLGDAAGGASDQTVSSLATSGTGTANAVVGGGSGVSTLTVNQTVATTYAGALGGAGTNENNLGLMKTGAGSLTLSGTTLSYNGGTTVTDGMLTITGPVSGTSSLAVFGTGSVLALNGGITNPALITSVIVGDGGTLSLVDGAGSKLSSLAALTLGGAGNGHISLNLNVGDLAVPGDGLNTDTLKLASGGVLTLFAGNKITFNITDTGLNASQDYVLLDASAAGGGFLTGGLTLPDYLLGITPSGFTSLTLSHSTNNQIILTTGTLITGNLYWRGLTDSTWNASPDNWSTDKAGNVPAVSTPGQGTDVVFQWDAPTNDAVTTALGQNFKINSLTFEASTTPANTPTAVTINSSGSSLEIAPQLATDGIRITAGGPPVVNITTPLKLGASQTWNVADAGSALNVSGVISGTGTLSKTGPGLLNLSGANTFANGLVIKQGTVVGTVSASVFGAGSVTLGDTSGANAATLQVNTTGLTYANPIVLATGTTGTLTIGTPVNSLSISPTFSGGITGTNNVVINNQSLAGTMTFSTAPINHAGSFTNASSSTGTVTVTGGVGANVTGIILNSTTSALTVSTTPLTVNATATTLQNISGVKILTVSGGITGTGNLVLKNDSGLLNGVTVSGSVNPTGTITNSGSGVNSTAGVIINGVIGTNVTGVIQDSPTSTLQLTAANTFTSGILIKRGILESSSSLTALGGSGNVITLGDSVGGGDAALRFHQTGTYDAYPINVAAGSGTRSIMGSRTTGSTVINSPIFLANNLAIIAGDAAATSANATFHGGITGTGNLIIDWGGATLTGGVTFSTNSLNMTGTISNNGTLPSGATVINAVIGPNVTGVVQNSTIAALTLAGANTFVGGVTLNAGTLNLNNATALGGTAGTLVINGGTINNSTAAAIVMTANNAVTINNDFTFTGTSDLNLGTGTVSLGTAAGTARTITTTAKVLTLGGVISDGTTASSIIKAGAGTLALAGANTFTGGVTLNAGILGINSSAALGATASTLVINGGTLDNTSAGAVTVANNNPVIVNGNFGFAGTQNLNLGTGATTLAVSATITTTAGTLTLGGAVDDGANTFNLTKDGAGTLVLAGLSTTAASNYSGTTVLNNGTMAITSNAAFTGGLTFGAAAGNATAASLDLSTASATFAGPTVVQTSNSSAASVNTITIGAGQKLQLNGAVTVGYNPAATATTRLTVTGADGTLSIGASGAPINANVQIGASITTNVNNAAIFDMSGLGTFYANLGTGTFRVGDPTNSGGSATVGSVLTLAANSTIIATTITSDSPASTTQTIKLGSGTNVFNATTITIGGASNRATGILDFNTGTGTLKIRGLAGDDASRATLNVQNGAASTASSLVGTVNLAGHSADLLLSTLTIGGRSAQTTGNGTGTFSFDTGTLDATTVVVATRTGSGGTTGAITGTLNLNQGVGTTGAVTIGTLNMGINSGSNAATNGQAKATLNIGGNGTVGITTLMMANNTIGGGATAQTNAPVESLVSISGGTTTIGTLSMNVNGSANTGTNNASLSTLEISGGTVVVGAGGINMAVASNAAATATSVIRLTGGSLTMGGNLTYAAGVGTENTTLTLAGGTLDMGGFSIGGSGSTVGSGTGSLNFESGRLRNVAQINNGADLTKTTAGTLVLEGSNAYTGRTVVTAGKLSISSEANLGANPAAPAADQLLLNGGTLLLTASLAIDDGNRGITVGASGGAFETAASTTTTVASVITGGGVVSKEGTGTLIFTAANTNTGTTRVNAGVLGGTGTVGGDLVVTSIGSLAAGTTGAGQLTVGGNLAINTGGILLAELGGVTFNAAAVVSNEIATNGNLNAFRNNLPSSNWENYINGTTAHDHLVINGTSTASVIDGVVKLSMLSGGYVPANGDIFDLLDWSFSGNLTGTPTFDFSAVTLDPGLTFNTDLFLSDGIIVVVEIVPEPSRAVLLLLGLFGLVARRRRR